jgi:acyl-CoA synthetase (AMP-forming)/AMP-acid ligase II
MQEDAGSNLLHHWIARAARAAPDKPWVVAADDGRTASYGQLREMVGRFATVLRRRGLGPNDCWPTIRSSNCCAISVSWPTARRCAPSTSR